MHANNISYILLFYDKITLFKGHNIEALISVATIYFFIVIGFIVKRTFKERIDQTSFILLNLYFLQPILIFWGLTRAPLNFEFVIVPVLYFVIIFICLGLMLLVYKSIFSDSKDQSVFLASSLVGNTGNLGIPLGIALFGVASVPYTSILNIANVFFIYIFSVYFFAKEQFSFAQAFKSIFKIPAIWFSVIAVAFNYYQLPINEHFNRVLEMGSYTAIVMQLIIFGIYLSEIKVKTTNWKLSGHITIVKQLVLPIVGLGVVLMTNLDGYVASILLMELMVPLAVNNVNLAALYNCRPHDVTTAILITSIAFIALIYFYLEVIQYFFGAH
ncbi:AEC family transporter [Candidatus Marinarcus aquaticus]|uniref:Permease n=1 Tax=Candidatus Marinarcus aquaticus TaxID=2044504 RepID=A0A4Q0XQX0_9BACT|nr:AEC family transporter [Candidatus Marinarcus aquaticus]RXJ58008.1 permease [Candidatus Marinarcus aquaticus]